MKMKKQAAIIPGLSEASILAKSSNESFSRGRAYYERGSAGSLALRGDTLQGEVEGSQYTPYQVRVTFDAGGITAASCSCPYTFGGWCKHIVAVLLACLHTPAAVEARPPLDALLADLDRVQLQAILLGLAERDPALADAIERQVALLQLANAAPQNRQSGASPRRTAIDQQAIRQQVRFVMRPPQRGRYDDYDYYDDEDPGSKVVEGMRPLLEQARPFVEGGSARSALEVLEAVTDEYLDGCRSLNSRYEDMYGIGISEGSVGEFFGDLAEAWAEAILTAELDIHERDEWGEKLAGWNDQADDLGAGTPFDLAVTAAEQGWDYSPLLRVFDGEITDKGAWEDESPHYADDLALVRLRVLERQGRYQEYLYLAQAEGQIERYVVMLAKIGRTQEAVEEGIAYLVRPNDVLEVAKALRERGELDGALRIAEHGVALKPPQAAEGYAVFYTEHDKAHLAAWTADLAAGMGQRGRALHAAETAFRAAPSLSAYLKVQELAGERWADVRSGLLGYLRESKAYILDAKVDVFLHEGLIDDAIAAVKGSHHYTLLERVMDAALSTQPEWVIKAASEQAERIMDAGKAQSYDYAVGWLRRARDGYRVAGRIDDWRVYLNGIRAKHGRKYKLMGLIDNI
jgi:uncharacterized Zn finger protein